MLDFHKWILQINLMVDLLKVTTSYSINQKKSCTNNLHETTTYRSYKNFTKPKNNTINSLIIITSNKDVIMRYSQSPKTIQCLLSKTSSMWCIFLNRFSKLWRALPFSFSENRRWIRPVRHSHLHWPEMEILIIRSLKIDADNFKVQPRSIDGLTCTPFFRTRLPLSFILLPRKKSSIFLKN